MTKHFLKNKKNYSYDKFFNFSPALRLRFACAKNFFLAAFTLFSAVSLTAQTTSGTIRGTIQQWNTLAPMNNIKVESYSPTYQAFTTSSAVGSTPGQYSVPFNLTNDGKYQSTLTRTVDNKDGIATSDLVIIQNHVLAVTPITEGFKFISADANRNGSVTTADIVIIKKIILAETNNTSLTNWNSSYTQFIPKRIPYNGTGFDAAPPNAVATPNAVTFDGTVVNYTDNTANNYMSSAFRLKFLNGSESYTNPKCGYWAIKIGDVNGSASPSNLTNNGALDRESVITLKSETSRIINAGEEFSIVVKASDFNEIRAFQMGLKIDTKAIKLLNVEQADLNSISNDDFGMTHLDEGEFRMLWLEPNGKTLNLAENSVLFTIKAKALKTITSFSDVLNLDDKILQTEFYQSDLRLKNVELLLEAQHENTSNEVYPNPTTDKVNFSVYVEKSDIANISIIDGLGKSILNQENSLQKGINKLSADLSTLPTGLYFYKITMSNKILAGKIKKQ